MINKVVLVGRITKDPEVRYTSSGIASVSFSIAVDRLVKDSNGERQADFINCVAWRNSADFLSRYVKKGYMIGVDGRIQTRTYQGQDNQTRYVTEVVCDNVTSLQARDQNAPAVNNNQPQQPRYNNNNNNSNNPNQGDYNQTAQPSYQAPRENYQKESFSVDVADDDLPF